MLKFIDIIVKEMLVMKKIISRLLLISALVFAAASTTDVYGGPTGPIWDEFRIPIITLPIDILPCCNLPPCDDDDQGEN